MTVSNLWFLLLGFAIGAFIRVCIAVYIEKKHLDYLKKEGEIQ